MSRLDGPLRTILDNFRFVPSGLLTINDPFGYLIAMGRIPGCTPLNVTGFSLVQGGLVSPQNPIWSPATAYTWATADQTLTVRSSVANDGAGALTGALTIRVWWLNAAGVEATQDFALNGVNPVVSGVVTARRVNRVEVLTVGATGANEGAISVYWTDNATLFARMDPGDGIAHTSIQTVPAGYADIFATWDTGSHSNIGKNFALRSRAAPTDGWSTYMMNTLYGSALSHHEFDVPFRLLGGADYMVVAWGGVNNDTMSNLRGYRIQM